MALSTGTSFTAKTLWTPLFSRTLGWDKSRHVRHVGDVNGDQLADIVGFGEDGIHVALSSGSSFVISGNWFPGFAIGAGGWLVHKHPREIGDVNGDGKADIVGFGDNAVYVALSTGASFAPPTAPQPEFDFESGWRVTETYSPFSTFISLFNYPTAHPRFETDYTGNGRADIIGLGNVNKPFKEAALAVATSFGFSEKMIVTVPKE